MQRRERRRLTEFPEERLGKYKQSKFRRRRSWTPTHAGATTRELPFRRRYNVAGNIPLDPASATFFVFFFQLLLVFFTKIFGLRWEGLRGKEAAGDGSYKQISQVILFITATKLETGRDGWYRRARRGYVGFSTWTLVIGWMTLPRVSHWLQKRGPFSLAVGTILPFFFFFWV